MYHRSTSLCQSYVDRFSLVDEVFAPFAAQLPRVGDHQVRAEIVQGLTLIELAHNPTSILIIGIPPQHVYGSHQAAIFLKGLRQGVLLRIGLQLLHQERCRDMAQFHRARRTEHGIPPIQHPLPVDAARDMGLQAGVGVQVDRAGAIEAATADIPQPRGEAQAQQIEERKDNFGRARRIGGMLHNCQLRFIAQDGIEDIGGIACGDDHGLGAILRQLIRGPTVKGEALAIPQGRRKRPGVTVLARHGKALAIRG